YAMPGTRTELAATLGVTPEALYRTLSILQVDGTLAVDADRLRLRD
ncbi:MAG: winged helix-turn-helix domain-containing protein, partial [Proteobacteria bacterium]|nr:winged helix-turn-helix domain-containing protein [Burkholderiales bacterium]